MNSQAPPLIYEYFWVLFMMMNVMMRRDPESFCLFNHTPPRLRSMQRNYELEIVSEKKRRLMISLSFHSVLMMRLCGDNKQIHVTFSRNVCHKRTRRFLKMTGTRFDYPSILQNFCRMHPQQFSNQQVDIGKIAWMHYFGRVFGDRVIPIDRKTAEVIALYGHERGDPLSSLVLAMISSEAIVTKILDDFVDKTCSYYYIACGVAILNERYSSKKCPQIFQSLRVFYRELKDFLANRGGTKIKLSGNTWWNVGVCMDANWVLSKMTETGCGIEPKNPANACRLMHELCVLPHSQSNCEVQIIRILDSLSSTTYPRYLHLQADRDDKSFQDMIYNLQKGQILRKNAIRALEMTRDLSMLEQLSDAFCEFETKFMEFQIRMYSMFKLDSFFSLSLNRMRMFASVFYQDWQNELAIVFCPDLTLALYHREKGSEQYYLLCSSDQKDHITPEFFSEIIFVSSERFVTKSASLVKLWKIEKDRGMHKITLVSTIHLPDLVGEGDRCEWFWVSSTHIVVYSKTFSKLIVYPCDFSGKTVVIDYPNVSTIHLDYEIKRFITIDESSIEIRYIIGFTDYYSQIVDFSKEGPEKLGVATRIK